MVKYVIWQYSEKFVHRDLRHTGIVDRPAIRAIFFLAQKFISEAKYAICRDSKKSALGGLRYLTVAGQFPLYRDNAKSESPLESLLSTTVVIAWSHLRLGLVSIFLNIYFAARRPNCATL